MAYLGTLPGDEQSRVGGDLVSGAIDLEFGGYVLSYLLGAPTMPTRAHAGAAVRLDWWERVRGKRFHWSFEEANSATSPAWAPGARQNPVPAIVDGLTRGGTNALDFFAPQGNEGIAEARMEYWFGERLYRDDAAFDAVARAVAAATAGDPNLHGFDLSRPDRSAATISRLTETLAANETQFAHMSEDARAAIASAYGPYVGDIVANSADLGGPVVVGGEEFLRWEAPSTPWPLKELRGAAWVAAAVGVGVDAHEGWDVGVVLVVESTLEDPLGGAECGGDGLRVRRSTGVRA